MYEKLMLKRLCWISPELNPFMNGSQVQILKTLALETNPNVFRTHQKRIYPRN